MKTENSGLFMAGKFTGVLYDGFNITMTIFLYKVSISISKFYFISKYV